MEHVDVITYNGIRYRRYPQSEHLAQRSYYYAGIADREAGRAECLHRDIYRDNFGEIPEGWHVHHRDDNPLNNDPSNLECVSPEEHAARHHEEASLRARSPEALAHLDRVRPLAAEWHKSPEGLEWHRQHAREMGFGVGEARDGTCDHCGKTYSTNLVSQHDRFCSNACKAAARRASGVDDEQRVCAWCDAVFTVNKYAKKRYCDRDCAGRARSAKS